VPTVICEGLGLDYRQHREALEGVSFILRPGVTGLVGINGAGKSTLLQILAGGLRPSRGSVRLDGVDPFGRRRREVLRRVALMPQSLEIPGDVRVKDAVAYCGWLRGMRAGVAASATSQVLDQVGLADRATHKLHSLSGGMRRRVALAQALVSKPDLLLLDEPTTGLDPEQRAGLRELVAMLPGDHLTVVSSHVMEDLETLADRIMVVEDGRLIHAGSLPDFRADLGGSEQSAEHAFLSLISSRRQAR
jgi:ABC-2 type transport system ATP-binding protein